MVKFKIFSDPYGNKTKEFTDPYEKTYKITYQKWNNDVGAWTDFSYLDNPYSDLFKAKLAEAYFPFVAKDIVDILISEYVEGSNDETLEIVFEGSEDEYNDFLLLCQLDEYKNKVHLTRSERGLANASDVLPRIKEIFNEMKPLIEDDNEDDRVNLYLSKYTESSDDTIPVCVIGNYSTGKSTFINALVGENILPSNSNVVTSRVYKILKSDCNSKASVKFELDGKPVNILIDTAEVNFGSVNDSLKANLQSELEGIAENAVTSKLNKIISVINEYDNSNENVIISDTIEITTPFASGVIADSDKPFIIFDTPGSNSADNIEHSELLKKALSGFTNGIPVYVAGFDDLQSTDNETLCKDILQMPEFDSRFSMIVINKADSVQLPENGYNRNMEKDILGEVVPRNLYTEGIFFVSSIMGLGAKQKGNLNNGFYSEIYEEKLPKFSDSNNKNYKCLYKYNIMPEQLKIKAAEESLNCQDVVYANSGLYWVEKELLTFADKYAPYNKCSQSKKFLNSMLTKVSTDLQGMIKIREGKLDALNREYEEKKKALEKQINDNTAELYAENKADYDNNCDKVKVSVTTGCSIEKLKNTENRLAQKNNDANNVYRLKKSADTAFKNIPDAPIHLADNIKRYSYEKSKLEHAKQKSRYETREQLLNSEKERFKHNKLIAKERIQSESNAFWTAATESVKNSLYKIVSESTALEDNQRIELADMIMQFKDLNFNLNIERIFNDQDRFKDEIKIFDIPLKKLESLSYDKIKYAYENGMNEYIRECSKAVAEHHLKQFDNWKKELLKLITKNMESYNPSLSSKRALIEEEQSNIDKLTYRRNKLTEYYKQIESLMEPKPL